MKWQTIEFNWDHYLPKAKRHWRAFSEAQLATIKGNYNRLVDCLSESYGLSKDVAEEQIREWSATFGEDEALTAAQARRPSGFIARLNAQVVAHRRGTQRTLD